MKKIKVTNLNLFCLPPPTQLVALLGIFITLTGCTNSALKKLSNQISTGASGTPGRTTSASQGNILISTVSITTNSNPSNSSGTGTNSTGITANVIASIFFNTASSGTPISNHCNLGTSGTSQTIKSCNCQFSWTQVNASTSTSTLTGLPNPGSSIPHLVQQPLLTIQPNVVTCAAPSLFNSEIIDGTQINVKIIAGNSNPDFGLFNVPTFSYIKSSSGSSGSFSDSEGRAFSNILHYSCYGMFQRGMSVQSKTITQSQPTTGASSGPIMLGSQFCVAKIGGSTSSSDSCPNLTPADYSSQNYYYSLYVGSAESGSINGFNDSFYCPLVKEALGNNGTVGTQNKFWPLDATFALAKGPSSTFSVGVAANTQLSITNDAASNNTSCQGLTSSISTPSPTQSRSGGSSGTGTGFVHSCLGYATAPNSEGTCSYFKDASGQLVQTFRLRKYIAIFPRLFDTTGAPAPLPQGVDTIYVLDRPVKGPSNSNPLQPYTMLGPKPCPYSFYDKIGVAGTNPNNPAILPAPGKTALPAYVASNDPAWNGKNIDGIEFPNQDSLPTSNSAGSCSTTFPILNSGGQFTLTTVNLFNQTASINHGGTGPIHEYVRPTQPFLPHYEEDTTFQACAPQATPLQDPPLHFVREPTTGNVAWCSESYPSQNDNLQALDPPASTGIASGKVAQYTSHTQKNSASQPCAATLPNIPYVGGPPIVYCYPGAAPAVAACNVQTAGVPYYALHPNSVAWDNSTTGETCDRTVVANRASATAPGTQWPRFPLLAPAANIEDATWGIGTDKSYHCLMTFDNNSGKANLNTPSEGCCGLSAVSVGSGVGSVTPIAAHLEPDVPCKVPKY